MNQYLISIWGCANISDIKPLKKLQNKIIKFIHKLWFLQPTLNLYKPLGYLNLENLYVIKTCIFIYSLIIHKKKLYIQLDTINTLHQTRQSNMYQTIKFKSNRKKNTSI